MMKQLLKYYTVALAAAFIFTVFPVNSQNQVFTSSGTFTVPSGITTIIIECWGAGGAGGGTNSNTSYGGGGGAGGAYARKVLSVIPGSNYTVTVGGITPGNNTAGADGAPSWFGSVSTVYAEGGAGGAAPNGGSAAGGIGSASNSIGDIVFPGGNGAGGTITLSGGGGGGAGSDGAGGNASGITEGTGTTLYGGDGGPGSAVEGDGSPGSDYGGGGSGAFIPDNTNHDGGDGAQGLVIVSWSAQVYYVSGSFTVPPGVTSVIVECWGAGGAGGGNTTANDGGGGGGGGAYARSTLTVTPGSSYTVTVGSGGTGSTGTGSDGGDTWFDSQATILAKGGSGGNPPVSGNGGIGGTGGLAALSLGTVVYNGGNGGTGRNNNNGRGGPGGSSAGTDSDGTSGSLTWSTTTAGPAPSGGGIGGDGGGASQDGFPGSVPGGGGGGSGDNNVSGGNGASGLVLISWEPPVFYTQASGDPGNLANWETSDGYSPSDFLSDNQFFVIQTGHVLTTSVAGWAVAGSITTVQVQGGAVLNETTAISISSSTTLILDDGSLVNHNVNSVSLFDGGENFDGNSTVNYGLTGDQTVADVIYGNLTLSGSGIKTISSSTVEGIMSMEGIATASAAPSFGTGATLQYKGSSAQTTGNEFPASFTSAGGVVIDNPDGVTLNGSRTITTALTFLDGIISTTGSYSLILGASATVSGAGTGKYVYGNLRKDIGIATASVDFEIGDASNYTPVSLLFTGTTNGTGNIVVNTTPGDHPDIGTSLLNPLYSVNRYWTLTNNGVTGFTGYDAEFTFVAGDMDAGTDYSSFVIGNYSSGSWTYPSIGNRTSTSTQATGLTVFGDFQIGYMVSDFRSAATGNWNQASTWEIYSGGSWIPAPIFPAAGNGTITILNSNEVTVNSSLTVDQLTVDAGGILNVGADITVPDGSGDDITVNGTINCQGTYILTGPGSFVLAPSASISIGSPDGITSSGNAGNIQTSTRTFDAGADYAYNGSSLQNTGNGLPSSVNNLTIDNASGVNLTASVTINGTLSLVSGELSTGGNDMTFQTSDVPVSRTAGTLTFDPLSSLYFGSPGNTGGAAITLPDDIFTAAPVIDNLSVYRVAGITLNNQLLSVKGVVLCNGPLATSDNLLLVSDATQTALIDGSGTGAISGNVTMQRYLASGFGYKYVSSPFLAATVNEFADDMTLGYYTFYRYDESRTSSGWVYYHSPTTNPLNPLEGYAANFGSASAPNTFDLTGTVSNGLVSVTLYNNNNTYTQGFSLVGNPYPSPLDWDASSGWTKTNIDDALYYFKASATDQYGGTYSTYINGISSDGLATGIIPSMQGFFVHVSDGAYPVTGTLAVDNNARITDLTHGFLKSDGTKTARLIRLSAEYSDDAGSVDHMVVYIDEKATGNMDSRQDALKLMNTDLSVPNIYSVIPEGKKLSINALPHIEGSSLQIPLGIKANRQGSLVIKLKDIDPTFALTGVYLFDAETGINQDLLNGNDYTVALATGEYADRFYLNIGSVATGSQESKTGEFLFRIYSSAGIIKAEIGPVPDADATFTLYNLLGQPVYTQRLAGSGTWEINASVTEGIYIATILSGKKYFSKKIFIQGR